MVHRLVHALKLKIRYPKVGVGVGMLRVDGYERGVYERSV
jgi:hypothetical protein